MGSGRQSKAEWLLAYSCLGGGGGSGGQRALKSPSAVPLGERTGEVQCSSVLDRGQNPWKTTWPGSGKCLSTEVEARSESWGRCRKRGKGDFNPKSG